MKKDYMLWLLLPLLLLTTTAAHAQDEQSEVQGLTHDELQIQRWLYEVNRREVDPEGGAMRWRRFFSLMSSRKLAGKSLPGVELAWESVGDQVSGQILSHAFDPTDARTIWIGSGGGGLWKTTDGGEHWQPMTDHIPAMPVSAVVVHPEHGRTILMGTYDEFGIGGELADSDDVPQRHGAGVLRSTDGGETWKPTTATDQMNCNAMVWDPIDTRYVYLASSSGVWRSDDEGATWARVLPGNAKSVVVTPEAPSVVYAGFGVSDEEGDEAPGVYQSTDYGQTWSRVSQGLPADSLYKSNSRTKLALSDASPNVLYVAIRTTEGDALYQTSDGAENWKKIDTTIDGSALSFYATWVSPFDADRVLIGGVRLYQSDDGGASWDTVGVLDQFDDLYYESLNPKTGSWIHVDHQDLGFHPEDPNTIYDFSDGGVFVSTDGGATWAVKNKGLMTLQIYGAASSLTDTTLYAVGTQDQGLLIYDGRAAQPRWRKWVTGDGSGAIFPRKGSGILYGTAVRGNHWLYVVPPDDQTSPDTNHVLRMQNGVEGSTSEELVRSTGLWITPKVRHPHLSQVLFTASKDAVYKLDLGTIAEAFATGTEGRWDSVAAISTVSQLAVDQVNANVVYAYSNVEDAPSLWRSRDGGMTWDSLAYASETAWPDQYVSDLEADPDQEGVLYATRDGYGRQVWRSTDYGTTWEDISRNLPPLPVNTIVITPDSAVGRKQVYVGTDFGVFMAYLDDLTPRVFWRRVKGGLPHVIVNDMHIHPVDRTLRVGTYGRGFWKAKLPDIKKN